MAACSAVLTAPSAKSSRHTLQVPRLPLSAIPPVPWRPRTHYIKSTQTGRILQAKCNHGVWPVLGIEEAACIAHPALAHQSRPPRYGTPLPSTTENIN